MARADRYVLPWGTSAGSLANKKLIVTTTTTTTRPAGKPPEPPTGVTANVRTPERVSGRVTALRMAPTPTGYTLSFAFFRRGSARQYHLTCGEPWAASRAAVGSATVTAAAARSGERLAHALEPGVTVCGHC